MAKRCAKHLASGLVAGLLLGGWHIASAQDEMTNAQEEYVARTQAMTQSDHERDSLLAAIHADRERAISDIVTRWTPDDATGQFVANLKVASSQQLYAISQANSFDQAVQILLFGSTVETEQIDVIVPEQLAIGQTTQDFVYAPVTPCRVADTRFGGGGVIVGGTNRAFFVYGNGATIGGQGGNPAGCPSPRGEPRAVHINVTIVPQSAAGFVKVYPANVPAPTASLVNYRPGVNIANAATVQTFFSLASQEIRVFSSQDIHVVIDVLGYYHEVDKLTSSLVDAKQGGYDIGDSQGGVLVTSSTFANHFQNPNAGDTTLTLNGGEDVLIIACAQVYKEDTAISNHIEGEIRACYRTVPNNVVTQVSGFNSETDFCFSSTGIEDQRPVFVSALCTNMPAGTFQFGFCARKNSSSACWVDEVNFRLSGVKINVVKVAR